MSKTNEMSCSFCGKARPEVEALIAGPTVNICCECVELCNEILCEQEMKRTSGTLESSTAGTSAPRPDVPNDTSGWGSPAALNRIKGHNS